MHYEEMRNYLSLSTDPNTVDNFDRGVEILNDYGVPDYMDLFDTVYGEAAHLSDTEMVDGFKNTLDTAMLSILSRHGVEVNTDLLISTKLDLCKGLFLLSQYEDKETLLLILEIEQTPQETFAELMELVTPYKADTLLSFIESIEESFISNFKTIIVEPKRDELVGIENAEQQVKDYSKFKEYVANRPLWSDKYFKHAEAIGLPFQVYLTVYLMEHPAHLTSESTSNLFKDVAQELYAIACLSEETSNKAIETIRKNIDRFYLDMNTSTKLDIAINQVHLEYSRG